MNIERKVITLVLTFIVVLCLSPAITGQAATSDFNIISENNVTVDQAKKWAKAKGATQTFIDLADTYFKYASSHGNVNPAIAYVQAAKESNYGKFSTGLDETYHNPYALKNQSNNDYVKFDSWDEGVQAQLDHLALYAGADGYPRTNTYDPNNSKTIKGTATTINDLSNKWSTSSSYGSDILSLYDDLLDYSNVSYSNNSSSSQSSKAQPNPGTPESKPATLKISAATQQNNAKIINVSSSAGWIKISGKWYYGNGSGQIKTGWIKDNNNWYYLQGDGSMITGLYNIDNKIYMFYDNGSMVTGWITIDGHWYYFNADGSMATGWTKIGGKNYYLYDTGAMAKGWLNLSGTWYYLNNDGSMATGWITSNGSDYYLDINTGRMLTDTTIDGYKIGSDGKRYGKSSENTSSKYYYGIDISHYDGDIDFNSVKSSGVQCVYIKATEGTTYVDSYLQTNYNGASTAGLKIGFYHFLVGTSSPETQADNFYNSIKDKKSDLKPFLDVESSDFDIMSYSLRFIAEFKKLSNMNIGIYTYSNFISNLDSRLSSYPLWEANYNNTPFSNLPSNSIWNSRVGHQYSSTGSVSGISGNVDLDKFTQDISV